MAWTESVASPELAHLRKQAELFGRDAAIDEMQLTSVHLKTLRLSGQLTDSLLSEHFHLVNTPDADGRRPLAWAARRGDVSSVTKLLRYGADPRASSRSGRTILHEACAGRSTECAKLILTAGANAAARDRRGWSALHQTVNSWHPQDELIGLLVNNGTDVNGRSSYGFTPLHIAASDGCAENTKVLLERGADINAVNHNGYIPVMLAVYRNYCEATVKLLVDAHCRLDHVTTGGRNILDFAATYANARIMAILSTVDLGALSHPGMKPQLWRRFEHERKAKYTGVRDLDAEREAFSKLVSLSETQGMVKGAGTEKKHAVTCHVPGAWLGE